MKLFRPKLVIFDLDGTLVEFPREYIFQEADRILPILSHPPVSRREFEENFCAFDFFRFVDAKRREQFIFDFWKTFNWEEYPQPSAFSWTHSTLCRLQRSGVLIAIATARLEAEHLIREALLPTGCLDFFSCIRPRSGDHVHWTDKSGQIASICEDLSISPADAVLVGDIPTDVTSARAAGIGLAVAVLSGGVRREVLETSNPDLLLEHIGELPAMLDLPS